MTREEDEITRVRKLVVVFDICSSTTILHDLKSTDNLAEWRNLLIGMKNGLLHEGGKLEMELYKFIGDGWVLLFPEDVNRDTLCTFLSVISMAFDAQFERSVSPLLQSRLSPCGLMFGIDSGELIRLEMNDQFEYIGRAINVAARLQSATKELPHGPSYKALFSKNSLNSLQSPRPSKKFKQAEVNLRNIVPPEIDCFLFETYKNVQRESASFV